MKSTQFNFETGELALQGNVAPERELNIDLLPLAPDFATLAPLTGGWQQEADLNLPEENTPSWENTLIGDVQLEPDGLDIAFMPLAPNFELPQAVKAKVPDISKGLGRRKDRTDLVKLQKFLVKCRDFMILNGQLCVYRPPCWRELEELDAKREIRALVEEHELGYCLTQREYTILLQGMLCDPEIPHKTGEIAPPEGKINFQDVTYDVNLNRALLHDPKDGFFSALNFNYRDILDSRGPVFEAFAAHISNGDSDVREQLLQLVALTLLRKTLKHFFVIVGPSNTGKTQFGRFLEELVGHEQVECVRDVQDFADRWTVGSTKGKALALCLDLPDSALPPRAVGIIKQFVGDDAIKGEKKFKEPMTFRQKPLLLMAGNHPLRIAGIDRETALLNRMVTIYFRNPVSEGNMRQELYKDLLHEAPYIVGQAIEAYYRLEEHHFEVTQTPVPEEYAPRDARDSYLSIARFLEEQCEFAPDAEVATSLLYSAYCAHNRTAADSINQIDFSRNLRELLNQHPGVLALKRVGGQEQRGYRGLRLREPV